MVKNVEVYLGKKGMEARGADYQGLELRCLGHYLAKLDNGAFAKEVIEGDIHLKCSCIRYQ